MPGNAAERQQLEEWYRQYGAALRLFAASLTGERSRSQDAVQQVFARLLEQGGLRQIADPRPYLFTAVRNAVWSGLPRPERNLAIDPSQAWFAPPRQDYFAELNLRRALVQLPEEQRQAVVLHVWGELTFAQIGEVLGVTLNTAASRYRYALSKLREAMAHQEDTRVERK
ncbi:MAG: RNA polymerase sigma factor [Bryobacteraceae bacterium]|nr:RNA polymerase sigma factor [Bryobacteraceae bacterium]